MSGYPPPIPSITGDHHLSIFTDETLGDPINDNTRYIQLGRIYVQATLTSIIFNRIPKLKVSKIEARICG